MASKIYLICIKIYLYTIKIYYTIDARHLGDTKMDKIEFGFDWVIKDEHPELRKTDLLDFYAEGKWEIVFVQARIYLGIHDGEKEYTTRYEVGNPLLGGIKNFTNYKTAEKYFFEMMGRVHRDAEIRKARGQ